MQNIKDGNKKSRLEVAAIKIIKNRGVAISLLIVVAIIIVLIIISVSGRTQATNEETIPPISDSVHMSKSSDGIWVPIPHGYSASKIPGENSVNGGFVIYEGEDIDWSYWENKENTIQVSNEDNDSIEKENEEVNIVDNKVDDNNIIDNKIDNTLNIVEDNFVNENIENTVESEQNLVIDMPIENSNNEDLEEPLPEPEKIVSDNAEIKLLSEDSAWMIETDTNTLELQKTRNQYVWIPMTSSDLNKMYSITNGKMKETTFWYSSYMDQPASGYATGPNINNFYAGSGSVYSNDEDSYLLSNMDGITRYELLNKEIEQNYNRMIKSIEKYGGFYIGRYETGGLDSVEPQNAVVQKGNNQISGISWYAMYESCKYLSDENENVFTSMISSSQWDAVIRWLRNCKVSIPSTNVQITDNTYIRDSTTFGNTKDASFDYIDINGEQAFKDVGTGVKIPSGSTEYTKLNNIYDMAGNVYDATTSISNSASNVAKVVRGGYYSSVYKSGNLDSGGIGGIYYQYYSSNLSFGCRAVLCIMD